jgi:Arc/MetJ-type ribon-helix-helix transcriptional regulator
MTMETTDRSLSDDMGKSRSTALVTEPEASLPEAAASKRPAKATRKDLAASRRQRREKVVRIGWFGAFLRPIGIALALILCAYAVLSIGTTYWRSYHRHLDHTAAVHPDRSIFDMFFQSNMPKDPVDLVVKDVDGNLHRVIASKSETDQFVNATILMLDEERARIKQAAAEDLDRVFDLAFADREQAVNGYADWFFAWKRSYVVMKESLTSGVTRLVEAGKYESLSEAVERDVRDYFLRHYQEQVLKPELRDKTITAGVEQAARRAHESYRRVIANGDMRLQLFLAKHTGHMSDVAADASMTNVKLDWDAQKWKAPTYLMEDRAFDGIVGVGTAAAGGTAGAFVLGPAVNRIMAQAFGQFSQRFAASVGTRVAMAQQGAVAGTFVHPAGGQVVGAVVGVLVGVAVDYFSNEANEHFNREKFVAANEKALDATIQTWRAGLTANLDAAIDRWFDDARSSVVLAGK